MFDEHGGTFDHVPPPAAIPPDNSREQEDFAFDRYGIRIPTIVISAHTQRGTVIRDLHANTSMTRTLREVLDLGEPFGARDGNARTIEAAFNRSEPRQDLPQLTVLPYTPGVLNPNAKAASYGDEPLPIVMKKYREFGDNYVSELGEATLRSAAALLGKHPDDAPTNGNGMAARKWLSEHFTRDGQLHLPTNR
jgi:hypothetical protein